MKRIFLFCFSIMLISNSFGQDYINNFKLDENKKIYWQNIVETELDYSNILTLINESGNFENIEPFKDKIVCSLRPYILNYKGLGYKYMLTPFYISRSLVSGNVIFEFKDEKYRVTIKNIAFIVNIETSVSNKQGSIETLEFYALDNKQNIKSNSFEYGSAILNSDFLIKTTFTEPKSENW